MQESESSICLTKLHQCQGSNFETSKSNRIKNIRLESQIAVHAWAWQFYGDVSPPTSCSGWTKPKNSGERPRIERPSYSSLSLHGGQEKWSPITVSGFQPHQGKPHFPNWMIFWESPNGLWPPNPSLVSAKNCKFPTGDVYVFYIYDFSQI